MSGCFKDLYDYELVKNCLKCEKISLMIDFPKDKNREDGLQPLCISCRTQFYNENREKTKKYYLENRDKIENYYLENRDRIKEYQIRNLDKITARKEIYLYTRYKTDNNFRLISITRSRIRKVLQGKTKSSSTINILGIDLDTYRKWIEIQTTPDMTWYNIEIDHVKAICLCDVSKDEELREAFNWKNTQHLLKQDHR